MHGKNLLLLCRACCVWSIKHPTPSLPLDQHKTPTEKEVKLSVVGTAVSVELLHLVEVGVVDLHGVPLVPQHRHLLVVVDLHWGQAGAAHGELDWVAPNLQNIFSIEIFSIY